MKKLPTNFEIDWDEPEREAAPDFSSLIEFLREHLTIRIQTDIEYGYYDGKDLIVRAWVSFDGEEICSDRDSVSIR